MTPRPPLADLYAHYRRDHHPACTCPQHTTRYGHHRVACPVRPTPDTPHTHPLRGGSRGPAWPAHDEGRPAHSQQRPTTNPDATQHPTPPTTPRRADAMGMLTAGGGGGLRALVVWGLAGLGVGVRAGGRSAAARYLSDENPSGPNVSDTYPRAPWADGARPAGPVAGWPAGGGPC